MSDMSTEKCLQSSVGVLNDVAEGAPLAKRFRHFRPSEQNVGISEYINKARKTSFRARLKARSYDFIVKEIDPKGNVVELTTFENPVKEDDTGTQALEASIKEELDTLIESGNVQATVRVNVTSMNKQQRTQIHVGIRNGYPSLQSETTDEGDAKYIVISKKKAHKGERQRYYWPNGRPNHTTFVLYKDNTDTMEAINTIAGLTRTKPSVFAYAGSKDKRAVTLQRVSVYRMKPDYLLGINKRCEKFKIGNVHFGEKMIQLGDLKGNRFIITLRDVTGGSDEEILEALEDLRRTGFINYFGLQRFGTTSIPTHCIGKKMLANHWEEACDLILRPRDGGRPRYDLDAARALWEKTRDAAACFALLTTRGSQNSPEGHLLAAIAKDPGNFQTALFALQKNTRLLYIHAYQSYVWNSVVSRRVARYGVKLLEGDLVLSADVKDGGDRAPVQVVTKENKSSFTVWDVVLPLPGYAMKYPQNEQREWFVQVVEADGFQSLDCFDNKNRSFAMRGSYRKVFCMPEDLQFEIKKYTDPNEPLVKTDWHILLESDENLRATEEKKIQIKHERRRAENSLRTEGQPVFESRSDQTKDEEAVENLKRAGKDGASSDDNAATSGKLYVERTAVILAFSLPASVYATMLLREFLRNGDDEHPPNDDGTAGQSGQAEDNQEDDEHLEDAGELQEV
ncbi:pseudouridylate synthase 7-like [Tropilaelaps mercedesae]|uniref:Pseudouridylate synthase 7-like n=1 Tax=Tropilaelaps mercedesae TaxID=418985 RepID=A0A1V9XNN8_9ACAR|nr:pseudouridylate synthase 7-like [Tropilaelaps mercedesae]